MAITVEMVIDTLEEMRTIYPFKNEDTLFNLGENSYTMERSKVEIITNDEKTGVQVHLSKNATRKE